MKNVKLFVFFIWQVRDQILIIKIFKFIENLFLIVALLNNI